MTMRRRPWGVPTGTVGAVRAGRGIAKETNHRCRRPATVMLLALFARQSRLPMPSQSVSDQSARSARAGAIVVPSSSFCCPSLSSLCLAHKDSSGMHQDSSCTRSKIAAVLLVSLALPVLPVRQSRQLATSGPECVQLEPSAPVGAIEIASAPSFCRPSVGSPCCYLDNFPWT